MSDNPPNEVNQLIPFIPAQFDDSDLSVYQFRLVSHLARRGDCYSSVPTIARICRMHPDTVWRTLGELEGLNIISREPRAGRPTLFKLKPISQWKPTGNKGAPETEGHLEQRGRRHRKQRGSHPPETKGHKGNPIKVTPLRKSYIGVSIPLSLNMPEFLTLWDKWREYLRQRKCRPTPLTLEEHLKTLEAMGLEEALKAIPYSIRKSYREPFPQPNNQKPKTTTPTSEEHKETW